MTVVAEPLSADRPTRERIVAAALRLFAERGYRGTSVGDIEAAAGLSPRSGALYKHFSSKERVLEAALAERASAVATLDGLLDALPVTDARTELTLAAHLALHELDSERDLIRILMREGENFPALRDDFNERLVRRGARIAEQGLRRACEREGVSGVDVPAVAAVGLSALVGFRLNEILFGEAPSALDEARFVEAWVDGRIAHLHALGLSLSPVPEEAES